MKKTFLTPDRDIKPGMLFAHNVEVLRPVKEGELLGGIPMSNKRMNKWWCRFGENAKIVCVFDSLTAAHFQKLRDLAVKVEAAKSL